MAACVGEVAEAEVGGGLDVMVGGTWTRGGRADRQTDRRVSAFQPFDFSHRLFSSSTIITSSIIMAQAGPSSHRPSIDQQHSDDSPDSDQDLEDVMPKRKGAASEQTGKRGRGKSLP